MRTSALPGYVIAGMGLIPVLLGAILLAAPALAQGPEIGPLLDRLDRVERDIRTLNLLRSRGRAPAPAAPGATAVPGAPPPVPATARLEVRLTTLEEELRALTGRIEEVGHLMDSINRRLDKLVGDVDYRLGVLERRPAGGQAMAPGATQPTAVPLPPGVERVPPGAGGPPRTVTPGTLGTITQTDLERTAPGSQAPPEDTEAAQRAEAPGVLPDGTPRERYTFAFSLLRQARYDEAEAALREFLRAHGDDPLADNARYWLGETYYVRGDFVQAAEVFLEGYQTAPESQKAPDTLLKLGMSLANLEKNVEACAAFDKLAKEFPTLRGNMERLVVRERRRGGCD